MGMLSQYMIWRKGSEKGKSEASFRYQCWVMGKHQLVEGRHPQYVTLELCIIIASNHRFIYIYKTILCLPVEACHGFHERLKKSL